LHESLPKRSWNGEHLLIILTMNQRRFNVCEPSSVLLGETATSPCDLRKRLRRSSASSRCDPEVHRKEVVRLLYM
jgi:hypothetical protein